MVHVCALVPNGGFPVALLHPLPQSNNQSWLSSVSLEVLQKSLGAFSLLSAGNTCSEPAAYIKGRCLVYNQARIHRECHPLPDMGSTPLTNPSGHPYLGGVGHMASSSGQLGSHSQAKSASEEASTPSPSTPRVLKTWQVEGEARHTTATLSPVGS